MRGLDAGNFTGPKSVLVILKTEKFTISLTTGAFLLFYCNLSLRIDAVERQAAADFFRRFPANWKKGDTAPMGLRDASDVKAAWTSLCRALFASAEFRYLN